MCLLLSIRIYAKGLLKCSAGSELIKACSHALQHSGRIRPSALLAAAFSPAEGGLHAACRRPIPVDHCVSTTLGRAAASCAELPHSLSIRGLSFAPFLPLTKHLHTDLAYFHWQFWCNLRGLSTSHGKRVLHFKPLLVECQDTELSGVCGTEALWKQTDEHTPALLAALGTLRDCRPLSLYRRAGRP